MQYLGILRLGYIHKDLSSRMNNIEELHNGSAIIGNGDTALIIVNELVHTSRSQSGTHHIGDCCAGIDVAQQLRLTLGSIRSLFQQYDLRLLYIFTTTYTESDMVREMKMTTNHA